MNENLFLLASATFAIGYLSLSLSHYYIPDWRSFIRAQVVFGLTYIPVWLITPESPRWLLLQEGVAQVLLAGVDSVNLTHRVRGTREQPRTLEQSERGEGNHG